MDTINCPQEKNEPKVFIIKTERGVTDNGKPQETVGRKAKGAKTEVKPARPPKYLRSNFFERGMNYGKRKTE